MIWWQQRSKGHMGNISTPQPGSATTTAVVGERIETGVKKKPKKWFWKYRCKESSFLVPQNPEGQQEPQEDTQWCPERGHRARCPVSIHSSITWVSCANCTVPPELCHHNKHKPRAWKEIWSLTLRVQSGNICTRCHEITEWKEFAPRQTHITPSVGIDLHLLDILGFALFVSDPPDPIPVSYVLTLQTNLSFGRMHMFWQYILV